MNRIGKVVAGALVCLGLAMFLLPVGVVAGPTLTPTPKAPYGMVAGVVVDLHGTLVPHARTAIYALGAEKPIVRGYTDDKGSFQYRLPGGLYELQAGWQQFPTGTAAFKVTALQKTVVKVTIAEKMD